MMYGCMHDDHANINLYWIGSRENSRPRDRSPRQFTPRGTTALIADVLRRLPAWDPDEIGCVLQLGIGVLAQRARQPGDDDSDEGDERARHERAEWLARYWTGRAVSGGASMGRVGSQPRLGTWQPFLDRRRSLHDLV